MILKQWLKLTAIITGTAFFLMACTNAEIGNGADVNQSTIYFDYHLTGEEDTENVTLRLQYRFAGPNGTTLLLNEPSQVTLDGVVLKADSSKMNGVYYEVMKPKDAFTGEHTITFTDHDKKSYTEKFTFSPFSIKYNLPDTIKREDLLINLEGLSLVDYVNVLLTDTVFTNNSVNRVDTVKNGVLVITKADLDKLATGPVYLDLFKEEDAPIENGTAEGGKFSKVFSARKAFLLVD
jgi:hypothetical protein